MRLSRVVARVGVVLSISSVLAMGAAALAPKPRLDLTVRPAQSVQDRKVVLEVAYTAGDLRAVGMQFDVECSDASRVTVSAGPAAEFANKTVSVADTESDHKRILVFGLNSEVLLDGVLAVVTIVPSEAAGQEPPAIRLKSIVAVNQGVALVELEPVELIAGDAAPGVRSTPARQSSTTPSRPAPVYATMACTADVNGDGRVDVADLQLLAAMASGGTRGRCDLNGDGVITLDDFNIVLNAIRGGGLGPLPRRSGSRSER